MERAEGKVLERINANSWSRASLSRCEVFFRQYPTLKFPKSADWMESIITDHYRVADERYLYRNYSQNKPGLEFLLEKTLEEKTINTLREYSGDCQEMLFNGLCGYIAKKNSEVRQKIGSWGGGYPTNKFNKVIEFFSNQKTVAFIKGSKKPLEVMKKLVWDAFANWGYAPFEHDPIAWIKEWEEMYGSYS